MKLRKVCLLKEMPIGEVWRSDDPADRFDASRSDVFVAGERYQLEQLEGGDVRITGSAGSVTVPWANVHYVVPEAEVKSVAKAGKR